MVNVLPGANIPQRNTPGAPKSVASEGVYEEIQHGAPQARYSSHGDPYLTILPSQQGPFSAPHRTNGNSYVSEDDYLTPTPHYHTISEYAPPAASRTHPPSDDGYLNPAFY